MADRQLTRELLRWLNIVGTQPRIRTRQVGDVWLAQEGDGDIDIKLIGSGSTESEAIAGALRRGMDRQ